MRSSLTTALLLLAFASPASAVSISATDFVLADNNGANGFRVYDASFSYLGTLPTVAGGNARGLAFNGSGNLVGTKVGHVVEYGLDGSVVRQFSATSSPIAHDAGPNDHIYIGTQLTSSIAEYTPNGAFVRSYNTGPLGTNARYDGAAVLPSGVLWAGGDAYANGIDVYDTTAPGDPFVRTIPFDNGQLRAEALFYSPVTNTVVMTDNIADVIYERALDGTFVRSFNAPGIVQPLGITRGPNGDVYATDVARQSVFHWRADGTFVQEILVPGTNPIGIAWGGNSSAYASPTVPEPSHLLLVLLSALCATATRRRWNRP